MHFLQKVLEWLQWFEPYTTIALVVVSALFAFFVHMVRSFNSKRLDKYNRTKEEFDEKVASFEGNDDTSWRRCVNMSPQDAKRNIILLMVQAHKSLLSKDDTPARNFLRKLDDLAVAQCVERANYFYDLLTAMKSTQDPRELMKSFCFYVNESGRQLEHFSTSTDELQRFVAGTVINQCWTMLAPLQENGFDAKRISTIFDRLNWIPGWQSLADYNAKAALNQMPDQLIIGILKNLAQNYVRMPWPPPAQEQESQSLAA